MVNSWLLVFTFSASVAKVYCPALLAWVKEVYVRNVLKRTSSIVLGLGVIFLSGCCDTDLEGNIADAKAFCAAQGKHYIGYFLAVDQNGCQKMTPICGAFLEPQVVLGDF